MATTPTARKTIFLFLAPAVVGTLNPAGAGGGPVGGTIGRGGGGNFTPGSVFALSGSPSLISGTDLGGGVILGPGTTGDGGAISFSDCFSIWTPTGACPFLTAATSSCIVLIDDLKTGGDGVSDFGGGGGTAPAGGTGGAKTDGGGSIFLSEGEGAAPDGFGGKPAVSPIGKLGGTGPFEEEGSGPAGGIFIWGLIGFDPLESDGLVGSIQES